MPEKTVAQNKTTSKEGEERKEEEKKAKAETFVGAWEEKEAPSILYPETVTGAKPSVCFG